MFVGEAQAIRADGTKECSKCGDVKPLSEFSRASKEKSGYRSACKACMKIDAADHYRRNKAKIDAQHRAYAKLKPEVGLAASTRYRLRNADKHLARVLDWQKRNPDRVIAIKARWHAANSARSKERFKAWLSANPGAKSRYDKTRRLREKCASGRFTKDDWDFLYMQQEGRCAGCGCEIDGSAHADHVEPLIRGGSNDVANRQLLCKRCNSQKHVKPMGQFLRLKRSGQI